MRLVGFLLGLMMFLSCVQPLVAQDVDRAMQLSESFYAYERRDFATAIDMWKQLETAYGPQPYLYYNLARAYEYLGDWGLSRSYDLRAKSQENTLLFLSRVGSATGLDAALDRGWARQEIDPLHPLIWLKRALYDLTRPVGWGLAGALLWTGFWVMLIIYLRRRVGRWLLVGLMSGVLLWFTVIGVKMVLDSALTIAVSLETMPVYSGPGTDYVTLTSWAEGYDLYILQTRGEWAQVMRADGAVGWGERRFIWESSVPN